MDMITFTASATVRNFVAMMGGQDVARTIPAKVLIASIGPVTSETLRDVGLKVDIEPPLYTIDALIEAIREEVEKRRV